MISETQQEQAALYAPGLLDADEAASFEREMEVNVELRDLVVELREATAALVLAAEPTLKEPPASLKSRLLTQFSAEARGTPSPPLHVVKPGDKPGRAVPNSWSWVPWAAAATLLGCCGVLALQETQLRDELAGLRAGWPTPVPAVNALTQVAVCDLEPTPEAVARPRAEVLWDTVRHQGFLRVVQLKPPAAGKDYQLWVVEKGRPEPVSAGIVAVDAEGNAKLAFEPTSGGTETILAFAISLEKAGGSATKEGPIVLIGKL